MQQEPPYIWQIYWTRTVSEFGYFVSRSMEFGKEQGAQPDSIDFVTKYPSSGTKSMNVKAFYEKGAQNNKKKIHDRYQE